MEGAFAIIMEERIDVFTCFLNSPFTHQQTAAPFFNQQVPRRLGEREIERNHPPEDDAVAYESPPRNILVRRERKSRLALFRRNCQLAKVRWPTYLAVDTNVPGRWRS